ncbi:unnamed protein product, partial [Vitis vinifera]
MCLSILPRRIRAGSSFSIVSYLRLFFNGALLFLLGRLVLLHLLPLTRQFKIIDVVQQQIRHGSNHGRFSRPRRAIKEVTPLPSFPNSCVEILSLAERNQVLDHLPLLISLHGKRLKSCRVIKNHMAPHRPTVGIKLPLPGSDLNRLPLCQNLTEVLLGDQIPVFLVESQPVVPLLIRLLIGVGGPSFGCDRP